MNAIKWYRTKIRELGGAKRADLLKDKKRTQEAVYPGFMYLFVYDPKWKKKLPYYDKFPLVIPFQFYKDGFMGINLHYLDYKNRLLLFQELLTIIDKTPTDPRARFRLAYRTLVSYARFKAVKPCIKRYLSAHIRSMAYKIEAPDWETALFLPVENFAKKSKTKVWKVSNTMIETGMSQSAVLKEAVTSPIGSTS